MKNGKVKRYILLSAAITVTVLAVLLSFLAVLFAKRLSYAAMWVFTSFAILSFWGMPILYYYAAKVRLALKSSAMGEGAVSRTAEACLEKEEGNVEA